MKKLEFREITVLDDVSTENIPSNMVVNAFSPYVNISKGVEADTTDFPDLKALYILNSN